MRSEKGSLVRHISVWVLLVSLVTAALLSIGGRVLIANIEYFKSAIEQELADYGITGARLENIEGGWRGFHPLLKITGASLSIPGRSQALSIDDLSLSVKLIPSLLNTDLTLEALHASVTKVILDRDDQGVWWLNDIPLASQSGHQQTTSNFFAFFERLPDFVNIDIKLLQIRDKFNNIDYLVQRGQLTSSRRDQQLTLRMSAHLPATLGGNVELMAKGDAGLLELYVKADDIDLMRVLQLIGHNDTALQQARLSLQSWAELKDYQLFSVINHAHLSQLVLARGEDTSQPVRLDLRQQAQPLESGWQLDSVIYNVHYGDQHLNALQTQLVYDSERAEPTVWVDALEVGQWVPVFEVLIEDEVLKSSLRSTRPQARIHNLVARVDTGDWKSSTLGFDFTDLSSIPHESIPGVNDLSGRLIADQGNARVRINPAELTVTFSSLFRDPIVARQFAAALDITATDSGLLLSADRFDISNPDINLQGRAWMEMNSGQRPFMSLRASYKGGKAASTSKYLPVSIMPERTVAWLDKSILGGEITQGGLLFHGRLKKISALQEDQSGEFHALFDVHDPDVDFLPDWPHARKGFGQASFHNLSMGLVFADVEFSSATLDSVNVSIANMLEPQLDIQGVVNTDSATLLDSLQAMPVVNVIDEINRVKQSVSGSVTSNIALKVPLPREKQKSWTLKATADLNGVGLNIPQWMVNLSKMNGRLHIDRYGINASELSGLYGGEKAKLDISTERKKQLTNFRLRGTLDSTQLASLLPDYLGKPIHGKSPWDIRVSVANNPVANKPRISINGASKLAGTGFDFPEPLKVEDQESLDFRFTGHIRHNYDFDYQVILADRLLINGLLQGIDRPSPETTYLNMAFGDTGDTTGAKEGFTLSGRADELNVNDWSDYLDRFLGDVEDPSGVLERVHSVNLDIARIIWGGHDIVDSHLSMRNNRRMLVGELDSSMARGSFELPYRMDKDNPLVLDLDSLKLSKAKREFDYHIDIQDMPNLSITSKVLSYDGMEFADLRLLTENAGNKFTIRQLDFSRNEVSLKSSGHWQFDVANNEHVSVFNIQLQGDEFGKAVSDLGLGNSLRKGKIDLQGQIGWGGSLFDINWPTLIGEVKLNLTNGYLNNIEPGAGRFVGLLSLSALPKRLFLDFGDVLNEGMQFDQIKGDFSIKGEIMSTGNASMKSASAKLKLRGDTNLRQKTYDQSMIIIPRVSDTLPVLGGIAAGSGVGWGLLLIQRIFKKPLEKSVEIEYKVTGSWKDPQLTLVPKQQFEQQEVN